MIAKEDENDNEVRREDQDRINQFARLNARLQEIKFEREQIKVGTLTIAHTHVKNNHECIHRHSFIFIVLVIVLFSF